MADVPFITTYGFTATDAPTARTLPNRLSETINVLDWGADPSGNTDSYTAIQAAVDYSFSLDPLPLYGVIVYIPPGTYLLNTPLRLNPPARLGGPQVSVRGAGKDSTILIGNDVGFLVYVANVQPPGLNNLSGLTIKNQSTSPGSGALLWVLNAQISIIRDLRLVGVSGYANVHNTYNLLIDNCEAICSVPISSAAASTLTPTVNTKHRWERQTISTMAWNSGSHVVTVTTIAPHGLPIGDSYLFIIAGNYNFVTGVSPANWFGAAPDDLCATVVATRTGASTFTYPGPSSDPGASGGGQWNYSESVGMRQAGTMVNCHVTGFDIGFALYGSGVANKACSASRCNYGAVAGNIGGNGGCYISLNGFHADRCTVGYLAPVNSGSLFAGNVISGATGPQTPATISGMSWSAGVVTVTAATHNLSGTPKLIIAGAPAAWMPADGMVTVTSIPSGTTFRYALVADPTGTPYVSGGTWNYPCRAAMDLGTNIIDSSYMANFLPAVCSEESINLQVGIYKEVSVMAMQAPYGWSNPGLNAGFSFKQCWSTGGNPPIGMTFGNLPGTNFEPGPYEGQESLVTDASTQSSFGGTVTAGGANHYKVRHDGTNWVRIG